MKSLKQKVSITLDPEVIEKAKILAEECDRFLSQYINLILREQTEKMDIPPIDKV